MLLKKKVSGNSFGTCIKSCYQIIREIFTKRSAPLAKNFADPKVNYQLRYFWPVPGMIFWIFFLLKIYLNAPASFSFYPIETRIPSVKDIPCFHDF